MSVRLIDYAHVFNHIVPEAAIIAGNHGGIRANWYVQIEEAFGMAANPEHAAEVMKALAERVRNTAIRDLGLRPILDAYEREVTEYKRANKMLRENLDRRNERIEELETVIASLQLSLTDYTGVRPNDD